MITISKQDNGVLFTFENSDKYLYGNGSILAPFNSLSIIADESDMITLRKSASNDIFLSARYDTDLGYRSKDDAIDDLKGMLFAETGGGGGTGSGITSGEVQTMIDESLDDYYDKDEVDTAFETVNASLSGKADTNYVNAALGDKADTSAVTAVANDVSTLSGQVETKVATTDFSAYSAATDARIAEDEEVTAAALNDLDENKQDALVYYEENTEDGYADIYMTNDDGQGNLDEYSFNIGGGSVDFGHYNQYDDGQGNSGFTGTGIMLANPEINIYAESEENGETESTYFNITPLGATINNENVATEPYVDAAVSGKADTSAITTAITSGSTDDEIPTAKAVYDATQSGGGGATYSAGTNISIDTANTINCTLNLRNGSNDKSIIGTGIGNTASKESTLAFGQNITSSIKYGVSFGLKNVFSAASNIGFGRNDNSLFTIGNGNLNGGQFHNALDIRQNGDIYFPDTDNTTYANYYEKPMVRLQDMYAALGGLKFVQCTQAEYDALVSGGTVDSSTIYFITNVVS